MDTSEQAVVKRVPGRWRRSVEEKRRIVQETMEPGASVARVARARGVNANQVFKWRRDFERGELSEPVSASASLLPVVLSGASMPQTTSGSIHIEFPGRALISIESGADATLLRSILESLRK